MDHQILNANPVMEKVMLSINLKISRIINGCFDCPFNYEYDMAVGYMHKTEV